MLFVGCLTSQQHASVSQGRICEDNFTCCHTEIQVADPTFHLTQSQYTDTGPTIPSTDPITADAWQGSHGSANFEVTGMTRPRKIPKRDSNPGSSALEANALTHSIPNCSQCLHVVRQCLSNKTTKQKDAHLKFGSLTKKLSFERTMAMTKISTLFLTFESCHQK